MRRYLFVLATAAAGVCWFARAGVADTPITPIAEKMSGVAGKLAKTLTNKPVQAQQEEVVRDLDELIASLEKDCAACRGMKRNNPTRPMADSMIRSGTGGIGTLVAPGQSEKDWAKLSDRERDRILQSMSEGFPPEYRTVLERYYRRLAEEKKAAATNGESAKAKPAEADAETK
jgi:hypothetical protein